MAAHIPRFSFRIQLSPDLTPKWYSSGTLLLGGSCLLELCFYPASALQPLLEHALQIFPVKGVRELGLGSEGSSAATDATVLQEGWLETRRA